MENCSVYMYDKFFWISSRLIEIFFEKIYGNSFAGVFTKLLGKSNYKSSKFRKDKIDQERPKNVKTCQ